MHDDRAEHWTRRKQIFEKQSYVETLREFGEPVPQPASVAGEVEVTTAA
jgi:hypothetical protein